MEKHHRPSNKRRLPTSELSKGRIYSKSIIFYTFLVVSLIIICVDALSTFLVKVGFCSLFSATGQSGMEITVLLLLTVPLTAASPPGLTHRSVKHMRKYSINKENGHKKPSAYKPYLHLCSSHAPQQNKQGHCPGFRGKKVKGLTGGTRSGTEDHPISCRRQTS